MNEDGGGSGDGSGSGDRSSKPLAGRVATASVRAMEVTTMFALPQEKFVAIVSHHPRVEHAMKVVAKLRLARAGHKPAAPSGSLADVVRGDKSRRWAAMSSLTSHAVKEYVAAQRAIDVYEHEKEKEQVERLSSHHHHGGGLLGHHGHREGDAACRQSTRGLNRLSAGPRCSNRLSERTSSRSSCIGTILPTNCIQGRGHRAPKQRQLAAAAGGAEAMQRRRSSDQGEQAGAPAASRNSRRRGATPTIGI
jgi:hypothetical protein